VSAGPAGRRYLHTASGACAHDDSSPSSRPSSMSLTVERLGRSAGRAQDAPERRRQPARPNELARNRHGRRPLASAPQPGRQDRRLNGPESGVTYARSEGRACTRPGPVCRLFAAIMRSQFERSDAGRAGGPHASPERLRSSSPRPWPANRSPRTTAARQADCWRPAASMARPSMSS
jgi:hypothetical protein